MVLETIESFYPADNVKLFTSNSLKNAVQIIEKETPFAIVTNITLKEAAGTELIKKIREKSGDAEIIIIVPDVKDLKKNLKEFGTEISDIIYKPVDIDILEILIKRAEKNQFSKNKNSEIQKIKSSEKVQSFHSETAAESAISETLMLKNENLLLKSSIKEFEAKIAGLPKPDDVLNLKNEVLRLTEDLNKEKNLNQKRCGLLKAAIKTLRTNFKQTSLNDIFYVFENALSSALSVPEIKIRKADMEDLKKLDFLKEAYNDSKVYNRLQNSIEIPFKINSWFYYILIPSAAPEIQDVSEIIILFRDLISLISAECIASQNKDNMIENEKNNSKIFAAIITNMQIYIIESKCIEKISQTKDELIKVVDDILDLAVNSAEILAKIKENSSLNDIDAVINNLRIITDEKTQNFDLLQQKIFHVFEHLKNIQLGLSGKKTVKISGDQYLFSKGRKLI